MFKLGSAVICVVYAQEKNSPLRPPVCEKAFDVCERKLFLRMHCRGCGRGLQRNNT
ncbi:hypothetical protein Anas_12196 [Armadillidium nasatum]|uniref:Uncharacterized protein n=1 Tax=Armadillidium nasatum TaxID=96803 RepID=A0A5N5TAR0_9CRUS|nr:hypothetical protein Anas_12196 [Armadillidium nasatum]